MNNFIYLTLILSIFTADLYSQNFLFNYTPIISQYKYKGQVESISIFKYEENFLDFVPNSKLISTQIPDFNYEYNQSGKMTLRMNKYKDYLHITSFLFDNKGNIIEEKINRSPINSFDKEFFKSKQVRKTTDGINIKSSLVNSKENERFHQRIKYHYDLDNLLVFRISGIDAPPTQYRIDKNGEIINAKHYSYNHGNLELIEIERQYHSQRIILERTKTKEKERIKSFSYDDYGILSQIEIKSGNNELLRREVYDHNNQSTKILIYSGSDLITNEIDKLETSNIVNTTFFELDTFGNRSKVAKSIEYKDEIDNTIKKYEVDFKKKKILVTEFHFRYYQSNSNEKRKRK